MKVRIFVIEIGYYLADEPNGLEKAIERAKDLMHEVRFETPEGKPLGTWDRANGARIFGQGETSGTATEL